MFFQRCWLCVVKLAEILNKIPVREVKFVTFDFFANSDIGQILCHKHETRKNPFLFCVNIPIYPFVAVVVWY